MNEIEKAIEQLKHDKENFKDLLKENCPSMIKERVENIIKAHKLAIKALEKQLNDRWVSVNTRLPNDEECNRFGIGHPNHRKFLCTIKIANYEATTRELYFSKIFGWKYGPEDYNEHVIAWQNLTEPYKEENNQ